MDKAPNRKRKPRRKADTNKSPDDFVELVRFSRDGDQFHYVWAARRLLRMLDPNTPLVAVSIEAVSRRENEGSPAIRAGEAVVDLAEYDEDERLSEAARIRYLQLKHSTIRSDLPWDAAGLARTLEGFSDRFDAVDREHGQAISDKISFEFITNRPIEERILESVLDLANGAEPRHPQTANALSGYVKVNGEVARRFWRAVRLRGDQADRKAQQVALQIDVVGYLAGPDINAPLQLKDLVVQRLLPEHTSDPVVRRMDVLRALGVSPDEIFPARNRIEIAPDAVSRAQEVTISHKIATASSPTIIEAPSGVGKSVLAMRLGALMPAASATVVYDCFGAGEYRQRAYPRHRPKDALVQIANELAAKGLCDPLLPGPNADATAYFRALLHRLAQAIQTVKRTNPDALVILIVDAADNAEMGAQEAGDERSFAQDLLRQQLPHGVRLVMLCRPERTHYLNPPHTVHRLTLEPFTLAETRALLQGTFPEVADADAREFHHRSSQNPRVQANALARGGELAAVLRALGPNPRSVDDTIADQLRTAVSEALDTSSTADREGVRRLCAALAMLRPLIPLDVLATVSGATVDAIRSFAVDFGGGRPIMVAGDAVQFRDEPVEDWFRKNFRADGAQLAEFIERLKPLAGRSAYVAAAMPPMLLEVGRLDELIEMALASSHLPAGNALQRRDVELQRLQFALRASLKARRYLDATKLALRVGGEAAGDSRHLKLIQENTDIAGVLLDAGTVQDLVSRRGFKGEWLGARHAYEAALLAQNPALAADARSRVRLARDWLRSWGRQPASERRKQHVTQEEIAELAFAALRLAGAEACLKEVSSWRPAEIRYHVMRRVASRLVDANELALVADLEAAIAASSELLPGLAVVDELARLGRVPSKLLTRALLRRVPRRGPLGGKQYRGLGRAVFGLYSMVNLVAAAARLGVGRRDRLLLRLETQLPPEPPRAWSNPWSGNRQSYLRAYALRDALAGKVSTLADLADPDVRKRLLAGGSYSHADDARRFVGCVSPVWSFARLRAEWHISPPSDGTANRRALAKALEDAGSFEDVRQDERSHIEGDVAELWLDLIAVAPPDPDVMADFVAWIENPDRRLFTSAWVVLAHVAARVPHLQGLTYDFCRRALQHEHDATASVDIKIDSFVSVARALLAIDREEAAAYLERAVDVASRIGDDAFDRWDCILHLGNFATQPRLNRADLAYRFGRCSEVMRSYLDKHFDWASALRILCRFSPEGGLAIVSRWRDRGVGWFDEVLTGTLEPLVDEGVADAREIAAFIGFLYTWDHVKLLDQALAAAKTSVERANVVDGFVYYLRLGQASAGTWRLLEEVAQRHGFPAERFAEQRLVAEASEAADGEPKCRPTDATAEAGWTPEQWGVLFGDDLLNGPDGFALVFARSDYSLRRREGEHGFWVQTFRRVPPGREAEFLVLVLQHPNLDPVEVDSLLKAIPPVWRERLAVKSALKRSLGLLLARHHHRVWHCRGYQRISIPLVAEAAGEPISWVLESLFQAFGSDATPLTSGEAFQLVSLLARILPPTGALEAVSYALSLIEEVLQPEDGDGPWSEELVPAQGVPEALAGLLWGCLGAPQAAVRWQAAHTVRRLCALEGSVTLDALVALACGGAHGPFVDRRFVFYRFHAELWLLIGLARAALEYPKSVARYVGFVEARALNVGPHVLICHFAKEAAIGLHRSLEVVFDAETLSKLMAANRSPFPLMVSDRYRSDRQGPPPRDWASRRFHFGFDMDRYWFEPLADVFDLTVATVEDIAESIVCDDWTVQSSGGWTDDARHTARVIEDDYTSHGSRPRVDSLNFYLSFHALMSAAGKLLRSNPTHGESDLEPRFDEWLGRHLLTRKDGQWLADLRDPVPLETRDIRREWDDENWRWLVTAEDLRRGFDTGSDHFVVWGAWTAGSDDADHRARVTSALVSPQTAPALLRALQTAHNPRDFRLPNAGDEAEINDVDFILKGWIDTTQRSKGFDEYDPWAGDIPYPPKAPAAFICEALSLKLDATARVWLAGHEPAFRAEVWGTGRDREGYAAAEGDRILVRKSMLFPLLLRLDLDLLVQVQVERHLRRRSWRHNNDEVEFPYPYWRLFLVKSDGSIRTI